LKKCQDFTWPGDNIEDIEKAISQIESENIVDRLWNHDYTIWKNTPDEITNRLGWLHTPRVMKDAIDEINQFVDEIRSEGFDRVLLLGMGGSSLAPEVFRFTFGKRSGFPDLSVLDSTDPDSVLSAAEFADGGNTLFVVSTKSGGTVETMSFMKYFYQKAVIEYGAGEAGQYFTAITDPGSGLESIANELGFRKIFLNDPNIGGRFSALSYFGLVPAGLVGIDISQILNRAQKAADLAQNSKAQAVCLGAFIGAHALIGKDKLTFLLSPKIQSFGAWVEQLIAESSGKEQKGILPVDLELAQNPSFYSPDRIFVHIKLKNDANYDKKVQSLIESDFPVVVLELDDLYDIGTQCYNWEIATAIVGYLLKINPFDQPNVETAKKLAKAKITEFTEHGRLAQPENPIYIDELRIFSDIKADTLTKTLSGFFNLADTGNRNGEGRSYFCIQAYLHADKALSNLLHTLQSAIHKKTKMATTLGFGPRFLHSTGQLHKGDAGHGLFIQIVGGIKQLVPIPVSATDGSSQISFGVLRETQSLGDREALLNDGRRVLRIEIGDDPAGDIKKLIAAIDK